VIADSPTEAVALRSHVREAEQAARRLILRADAAERLSLNARAQELRADAEALLAEISELSRRVTAA
jgi:hypothetical protein